MLNVSIRHRLGTFRLDVDFEANGRLIALFGPSGSGKTTLINLIAGLMRPEEGKIAVDGRVLTDTRTGAFVPRHKRRIGYVFQDARLFPHMTVSQNLRYGRWFTPGEKRYTNMDSVVELLGIRAILDRRPNRLSGGEMQRVAIGRALLASPRLILMDEPLASLDNARKGEIMPFLERLRDEVRIPIVYVSHSIAEVARLATDIVVLDGGRIAASGPTSEIVQRLDLLPEEERGEGGAVLEMEVAAHEQDFGMTVLRSAAGEIRVALSDMPLGAQVRVLIRARDVLISTERPHGLSALNVLAGDISDIKSEVGAVADLTLDCGGQEIAARITRHSCQMLGLRPGQRVFAVIKTASFDRASMWRGAEHDDREELEPGER